MRRIVFRFRPKVKVRINEVTTTANTIEVALRYPKAAYEAVTKRGRLGWLYGDALDLACVTGYRHDDSGRVTVTNGEAHMDLRLEGSTIVQVIAGGDRAIQKQVKATRKQVQQLLHKHLV